MIKNEKVLSEITGYQTIATIEALERAGVNTEGINLLRSDKELALKVARLINNKMLNSTEVDRQLLLLLDENRFFGPTDWLKYYGIKISEFDLPISFTELSKILEENCPFVKDKKIKETHYLFCLPDNFNGESLTVKKWKEIYPTTKNSKAFFHDKMTEDYEWQTNHKSIITDVARYKWYLMFEGLPKNFFEKNFIEQINDKIPGYGIPKLVECVPIHFLIYEKNGYFINSGYETLYGCGTYGRTASIHYFSDNEPNHICVGRFGKKGLYIYSGHTGDYAASDKERNSSVGMFFFKELG